MKRKKLTALLPMQSGKISDLYNSTDIRRRLQDIGFVKGAEVHCLFVSPLGDPTAYRVKETTVALRKEEASKILLE